MLRYPIPLLALTFAVAIVAATHAPYGPCDSAGSPALGIVEVTTGAPYATFYLDDRNYLMGNGVWIYEEMNGVWTSQGPGVHFGDVTNHNLQRGKTCGIVSCTSDECWDWGVHDPDYQLF